MPITCGSLGWQWQRGIPTAMLFWPAIFLVYWVSVDAHEDHLVAYGPPRETLLTLEGTEKTPTRVFRQKFKRFLTFNNDRSNIRVEMVFAIPVLHIPIGGNPVDGPYGTGISPVVDVNAKSVLAASVVLFMLFFVVPKLVRIFIPTFPQARALEESEFGRVLQGVESAFSVNATACWQNCVCSLVQEGQQNKPSSSNLGKVFDGISKNYKVMSGRRPRHSNIGCSTVNARRVRSARDEDTSSTEREARLSQFRDRYRAERERESSGSP